MPTARRRSYAFARLIRQKSVDRVRETCLSFHHPPVLALANLSLMNCLRCGLSGESTKGCKEKYRERQGPGGASGGSAARLASPITRNFRISRFNLCMYSPNFSALQAMLSREWASLSAFTLSPTDCGVLGRHGPPMKVAQPRRNMNPNTAPAGG